MKDAAFVLVALAGCLGRALAAAPELEIRIVYDNTSVRGDMRADWGFAAVVDYRGHRLLFDSGLKPDVFMENLAKLGVAPESVEQAIISHAHGDHTGGMTALLAKVPNLTVHRPGTNPQPFQLVPGVYSTGMVSGNPPEQALVIETAKGLVILTGCSHPGVVRMVEAARAQRGEKPVRLLIGGFHMLVYKPDQIEATVARLRELQVASIVPTHCTGVPAMKAFQAAFGTNSQPGGAGQRIVME